MNDDVRLRDVIESDIARFFEFEQDPIANRMAVFPARAWEEFSVHWRKMLWDEQVGKKTILNGNQVVGNVVSWDMVRERVVGYWIDRSHWGNGIATSALTLYLEHELRRPLYAQVAKHNIGSRRVLEKRGCTVLGEERRTFESSDDDLVEVTLVLNAADETGHPRGLKKADT